jgi:hypothetical protein
VLNEKELCVYCEPENFTKFRLFKQKKVENLLKARKIKYEQTDQMVDKGECGKERPDFMMDCGTHKVILEVDEHQHQGRACECEQTRMVNLTYSIGMPVVFIRYNPDSYKIKGKKIQKPEKERHDTLVRWIRYYMKTAPKNKEEYLRVVYMYFDEFEKEKFKELEHKIPIV